MTRIRVSVPARAAPDEVINVKAMIQHDMESGYRRDAMGEVIPRNIITRFECLYNDTRVFAAELHPGVAANPFFSFYTRATTSGRLLFRWVDQHGEEWTAEAGIEVGSR
jgi:sulfur-oxidizing protein SoxZ